MKKYGLIYLITNIKTGKMYVGQTTKNIECRFNEHCTEKRNRHISNAIRFYGKNDFVIEEVYSSFSKEDLNEKEAYFVDFYNTFAPSGYNHRAGGNQNGKCSDELRKKISLSKKGKPNLKKRGEIRTQKQRIQISRSLGGQEIVAVNLDTNCVKIYSTAHSTSVDGFQPWNVIACCKGKRQTHKNHKFYYINNYANQSGSLEIKKSEHAQRLGSENYNCRIQSSHESPTITNVIEKIV